MQGDLGSLSTDDLIQIYRLGCFPMAKSRSDPEFSIFEPFKRALLPIKNLHIPKRLKRKILRSPFEVKIDTAFAQVIEACAVARTDTWINDGIIGLFTELNKKNIAHSIECWKRGELVGGLYGLELGGTFCGESMFSTETDASKIALVHLCARLDSAGFTLLDAQFRNPHLDQFGLYEMEQEEYIGLMQSHLKDKTNFACSGVKEEDLVRAFLS
ncbi:MAG TPA: leucyl/phenylalanyl-tRNA--protein transferase [Alphaproteobacteria bacterium]|nr:leucyl/phenylalanyl-tRNA--protein transferase [Alphaproteobacteria bacterium]HNS44282.1 leucyl/phenylalanyl-tRNA--protein transferase [Alphaproteobacteria bacterium]